MDVYRLTGRAPKSYTYDTDGLRLVYKAVGTEQKVYMEPSSNGNAISAGKDRRQNNLVGIFVPNTVYKCSQSALNQILEVCRSISPISWSSRSAFFGGSPCHDIPGPTGNLLSRYSTMQYQPQLAEITASLDAASRSRIRFLIAACHVYSVMRHWPGCSVCVEVIWCRCVGGGVGGCECRGAVY